MRLALPLMALFCLVAPHGARSQPEAGGVPLADVLQILVLDRDLLAVDAAGGGQTVERLRLDESVLWKGSRGKIGVVVTDQRVLAVATGSAAWQETDYRRKETPPKSALLGDRVALVVTSERALGFDGNGSSLVEYPLGPRERVVALRTGESVGVVVTDRRALGLSPFVGGFFPTSLDLADEIESVTAEANLVTITSSARLLIFRANSGSWESRARTLR